MRKRKNINLALILGISGLILFQTNQYALAQYQEKEDKNYGNTPDKQVPYANYRMPTYSIWLNPRPLQVPGARNQNQRA